MVHDLIQICELLDNESEQMIDEVLEMKRKQKLDARRHKTMHKHTGDGGQDVLAKPHAVC